MNSKTKMTKSLLVQYILINNELWEIDYNKGHAIEVSGYKRREFLKNIIEYSDGTIEEFNKENVEIFTFIIQ